MMKLFNTLTRKKETFTPLRAGEVRIYTCGPTVYDFAHIGNLRAYIFADVLVRVLRHNSWRVRHIMNITDVGHLTGDRDMGVDKVERAANRKQKTAWEIASFYTDSFLEDLRDLNIRLPDKLVRATDHIGPAIELIKILEEKGFTYQTSDGVYFDTAKVPDYGKLAKLDIGGLAEGARVEKNPEKKNPTDFALWKFSTHSSSPPSHGGESKRQMEWKSPWGVGFPGWHIECSAMSRHYLGQPFDIHTGGVDHIPIHHTNEIAQSESAYGVPLAKWWLHNEFVLGGDDLRIGKSEGNSLTLSDLKKKGFRPEAYRYFALQGHYRSKLNFSLPALESAQNSLNNIYAAAAAAKRPEIGCPEYEKRFFERLNDDLNTPEALAVMWEMLRSDKKPESKLASLIYMDDVLGLSIESTWRELSKPLPKEIEGLKQKRDSARSEKNWKLADELRDQITNRGFRVMDTEHGTLIKKDQQ